MQCVELAFHFPRSSKRSRQYFFRRLLLNDRSPLIFGDEIQHSNTACIIAVYTSAACCRGLYGMPIRYSPQDPLSLFLSANTSNTRRWCTRSVTPWDSSHSVGYSVGGSLPSATYPTATALIHDRFVVYELTGNTKEGGCRGEGGMPHHPGHGSLKNVSNWRYVLKDRPKRSRPFHLSANVFFSNRPGDDLQHPKATLLSLGRPKPHAAPSPTRDFAICRTRVTFTKITQRIETVLFPALKRTNSRR